MKFLFLVFTIGLLFSTNILLDVYAEEESYPKWRLIFLNDEHRCLTQDKTTTSELTSLTLQYFREYEFDNKLVDSSCMSLEEYSNTNVSDELSLLILVLDGTLGEKVLAKNGYEGMYSHLGDDKSIKHTIIIKTNSINDLYTATATPWLLSHELSHYVLSYKGYNGNAIEYLLHNDKVDYKDCIGKSTSYKQCTEVKTMIRPIDLGKDFFVMPVYEPVVGKTFVKYLPEELLSSKISIELQREITKWWVSGMITDEAYSQSVLRIVNSPTVLNSTVNEEVLSLPNGFAILDKDSKSNLDWTPGPFEAFAVEEDISTAFSLIPFDADEIIHESKDFPQWFKVRAELWSESKIPDKIFFDGMEALLRLGIVEQ